MNVSIEVKRTEKCIGCAKSFSKDEHTTRVRIKNNLGYSICLMCDECTKAYQAYKRKKEMPLGV